MRWLTRRKFLAVLLTLLVIIEPISSRRGGGGGFGRGSSGARSGGLFGGSRSRGNTGGGYNRGSNTGGSMGSNNRGNYGVGGWNNNKQGSSSSGKSGGFFGGSKSSTNPKFRSGSGLGSMVRSSTFKNAIVGAAAGYLTYQAGKHLIRSAMAPMMWNNRPYYWGSNYYQQRPGHSMCRMPMEPNDQHFGNVYFQDQTRPREIVWGCNYNEVCCGYECCPGNTGGGYGFWGRNGYGGFGIGSFLVLVILGSCVCFIVFKICQRNSNKYQQGRTTEAPPQYY